MKVINSSSESYEGMYGGNTYMFKPEEVKELNEDCGKFLILKSNGKLKIEVKVEEPVEVPTETIQDAQNDNPIVEKPITVPFIKTKKKK